MVLSGKFSLKSPVTPLQVLIAVLPFVTGIFYEWQSALLSVALIVIIITDTILNRKFEVKIGFPLLFALSVVAGHVLSYFWAADKGMVWLGAVKFLPLLLFVLAATDKEDLLRFIPLSGVVMTVVSVILSRFDALKGHIIVSGRIGGFFEYPNAFAMFLLVCLILVLFKDKISIIDWVFAAIFVAGIALSGSRTVMVLLALTAVLFIVWVRDKKIKIIAAAAFVIAAVAAGIYLFNRLSSLTNGSTFYGRILYYIDAMPVILKHPLGLGYYGYYYTQGSFQTGVYSVVHIHNDLLQTLLDIGLIPAALGCIMVVRSFIKADFQYKVILAMLTLHLLFDFDMQFVSMSVILLAAALKSSEPVFKPAKTKSSGKKNSSKSSRQKQDIGPVLAVEVIASLAIIGLSAPIGIASFYNYTNDFANAVKVYPMYTEAQKYLLVTCETNEQMDKAADSILSHNPDYPLANNAKARLAFSSGDIMSMMDYKEKAIRFNRYSLDEYLDYFDMLNYSISLYAQSGDYESAEYCIDKCLNLAEEIKRVDAGTSKLGRMIDDKPELELPAEYAEFISALKDLKGI